MDSLRELWYSHRGKIVGGILGFVVAIVIIAFGFFKALFITLCTIIGCYIGRFMDSKEDLRNVLDRILSPSNR